ncbi:MAG: hypothetical protein K5681_09000 [Treponema sp.]|nr:hypothetical protein [Treponema sp.]
MANKAKKSKYPEGYIGRPKPMKTKTFEFHKPTLKNYIGFGIFLIIAAFITYIAIRLINVEKQHELDFEYYSYDAAKQPESYVLENNFLKFELDPATTQFSILQKNTGHVWYSNPQDSNNDPIALGKEKNNMQSPFLIKYSTINGSDDIYDLYSNSIKRQFYNVSKNGNEVRIDYTVGQMDREYIFPLAIYEEELNQYKEKLSSSDKRAMDRAYHEYDINKMKPTDDVEGMLSKYPKLKDEKLYLVFENIQTYLKEQMEKIFESLDYSYDDYLRHKELYKENNVKEVPAFNISVIYKLDGKNFTVDIPFSEISYKSKYPIVQVSVLPYFAAAGVNDQGFMFVPEGSGAIINFNNGKTKQNGYYADIYGWDYATDRKAIITETRNAFPVFGVSYGDSSFISIIEESAEYAGITAEIAGKLASYNYVRADYKMLHREQFEVTTRNTSAQYSYEKGLPENEKIHQVYTFIDSGSYVDMAKEYRNYLFAGEKKLSDTEIPFSAEIVGAIDKVQQVAGIPKTLPFSLTTYSESAEIINEIEEMGIKNANIKLSGVVNQGIKQKILKHFKFIKALGGKSDFNKMLKDTADTSAKIYIDASVQTAYRSNIFDGFIHYRDAAKFASDELAELNEYSPIWYGKLKDKDSYYLLNPRVISNTTDVFAKNVKKYGVNASFRDNGYLLSADYNDDKRVSRAEIKNQHVEKFEEIKNNGTSIMINGGNAYALKTADFVTNMTLHGNSYAILDELVPFYQIAMHGYRRYAGKPINLSYEADQLVLESAEAGAGLYFVFMNAPEQKLQESSYTEYYSANFDGWKDNLSSLYSSYNKEMGKVRNSLISDFEYLSDDVSQTKYENGYKVIVNFGYLDFTTENGVVIPARSYKVLQ